MRSDSWPNWARVTSLLNCGSKFGVTASMSSLYTARVVASASFDSRDAQPARQTTAKAHALANAKIALKRAMRLDRAPAVARYRDLLRSPDRRRFHERRLGDEV